MCFAALYRASAAELIFTRGPSTGKWFNVKWFTSKDFSCQGCHAEYLTSVRFKLCRKKKSQKRERAWKHPALNYSTCYYTTSEIIMPEKLHLSKSEINLKIEAVVKSKASSGFLHEKCQYTVR